MIADASRRGASRGSRASNLGLLRRRYEAIADAAHRLDVVARAFELLAQALHVRVDGARRDVGLNPPDVVEQRRCASARGCADRRASRAA